MQLFIIILCGLSGVPAAAKKLLNLIILKHSFNERLNNIINNYMSKKYAYKIRF